MLDAANDIPLLQQQFHLLPPDHAYGFIHVQTGAVLMLARFGVTTGSFTILWRVAGWLYESRYLEENPFNNAAFKSIGVTVMARNRDEMR